MPTAAEKRLTAGRLLLGARVRELRTGAGLQLAEFADLAGITQSQLSDFERGRKLPTLPTLDALATALDTTAAELLLGIYPWGSTKAPREPPAPPPDGRAGRTIRRPRTDS
jgi:transcriptional regulator with XRE-family HTH domain